MEKEKKSRCMFLKAVRLGRYPLTLIVMTKKNNKNMIELDKIFNEDCLVGMKRVPDESVDAIICDLPYGTTANKWDSVIPLDKLWSEYRRITKPNAPIVLFSQQPFTSALVVSNLKEYRYEWIWQKEMGTGFLNAKNAPMKNHENIVVFSRNRATYNPIMRQGKPYKCKQGGGSTNYDNKGKGIVTINNGERYPLTVIAFDRDPDTFHPTQKPVDLLRYLVLTYTNEGDTVLDNCMGSGTTAIACIREKRHFIGFEKDKIYWKKSVERVKNEQRLLTLF